MFLFLHFRRSSGPDKKCHKQVTRAIFYTHQTSGAFAHQMEKTVLIYKCILLFHVKVSYFTIS